MDKSLLLDDSPFSAAAWAANSYWHFIFTIKNVVNQNSEHEESWRVHDFCFGTRDVEQAMMNQVAKRYTKIFGELVDVGKASSWLDQVIVSKTYLF